jgi:hypothetical protein
MLGLMIASAIGQQGAPNEGQAQPGQSLKIDRDIEYARTGGQALKLDLYRWLWTQLLVVSELKSSLQERRS